ncbi:serine protease [Marivita sp. S2033]|uniref:S1 family peptidase n=1 Tax=Marivita sp. S2033 TaxID=3373187 RepID=UPI0039824720
MLCVGSFANGQVDPSQSIVFIACTDASGTQSQGSGYIFSESGHVLTAKHVVPEDSTCAGLIGRADEPPSRELVIRYRADEFDYAVLQFNPVSSDDFKAADIAPSVDSFLGSTAQAIGFPKGITTLTIRTGTVANTALDDRGHFDIGTETTQGMSGGPVIANGMIIGLVAGADPDPGTGFVRRYEALASDVFYEKLSSLRRDIARDRREQELAVFVQDLKQDDVCTELLREAIQRRYPDAVPGLQASVMEPPSNELGEIADYWVTITTGPARWLDCTEGRLQKSHYFPMGLILRPLRDLTIPDNAGEDKVWTVFQAEYGMLVLIDRRAVAPVSPDVGYVFAEGTFIHKLCGPNDSAYCNPGENLPPLNTSSDAWPVLTAWYSYLRTTDVAALEATYKEYLAFKQNQRRAAIFARDGGAPFMFSAREPQSLEDDPACVPQSAKLYRYIRQFDAYAPNDGSEYRTPVRYTFCVVPPDGAPDRTVRWRPMKVVTQTIAAETFAQLWWAAVEPGVTDITVQALQLLENRADHMVTRLACFRNGTTAGNQLIPARDAGLDPLDVALEEPRLQWSNTDPSAAYHFRMYRPARGLSPSVTFAEVPLYQDIDLKIFCGDDRRPERATDIRVHLYPVFPEPIVLDVVEMENWYLNKYQNWGFEGRRHLSNGFIERICDYPEYFGWRDTLERFLLQDAQIITWSESRLRVSKEVTARHFAHLIMAVLFFTDVQLQINDDTAGVCPI